MIHIDKKVSEWERFSIEDDERESLMEFLKANPEASAEDLDEWASDIDGEHETLTDTGEYMLPAENDGQATIEITHVRSDNQAAALWDNAPKEDSAPPMSAPALAANLRMAYVNSLLYLNHHSGELQAELRQLLLDVMDIVEQGPLEDAVVAAYKRYEEETN